jgi:hypothetical protein
MTERKGKSKSGSVLICFLRLRWLVVALGLLLSAFGVLGGSIHPWGKFPNNLISDDHGRVGKAGDILFSAVERVLVLDAAKSHKQIGSLNVLGLVEPLVFAVFPPIPLGEEFEGSVRDQEALRNPVRLEVVQCRG